MRATSRERTSRYRARQRAAGELAEAAHLGTVLAAVEHHHGADALDVVERFIRDARTLPVDRQQGRRSDVVDRLILRLRAVTS